MKDKELRKTVEAMEEQIDARLDRIEERDLSVLIGDCPVCKHRTIQEELSTGGDYDPTKEGYCYVPSVSYNLCLSCGTELVEECTKRVVKRK